MLVEKKLFNESHIIAETFFACLTLVYNVLNTIYSSCQQSHDHLTSNLQKH